MDGYRYVLGRRGFDAKGPEDSPCECSDVAIPKLPQRRNAYEQDSWGSYTRRSVFKTESSRPWERNLPGRQLPADERVGTVERLRVLQRDDVRSDVQDIAMNDVDCDRSIHPRVYPPF